VVGRDLGTDRDQVALATRNSASLRLGSTLATAKCPRSPWSGSSACACRSRAAARRSRSCPWCGGPRPDIWQGAAPSPDVLASVGKDAGHADLLCDHPGTHVDVPISFQLRA
jgi:hypothetical protein